MFIQFLHIWLYTDLYTSVKSQGENEKTLCAVCVHSQVCIIFSDFGKMQNVCSLLIEKLGTSVTISPPYFYHTPAAVDTLR